MERILVAVDGSEPSYRAARLAADIAARFGARLTLVHVIPPFHLPPDAYGAGVVELEKDQRKAAEELLNTTERKLEEPGVRFEKAVLYGGAAEELAAVAEAPDVGLVVAGSRGRNTATRILLGSVSDRLVHICKKPVLVVR